jgi:hypothetical protein
VLYNIVTDASWEAGCEADLSHACKVIRKT